MAKLVLMLVTIVFRALRLVFRSRSELVLENIALREQVDALKQKRPRPQLADADRAFWVAMRTAWNGWAERLVIVKPETVVKWPASVFGATGPRSPDTSRAQGGREWTGRSAS